MDCSAPNFPVLQYLLEFAQTHVHRVSDAIQLSHPLSSPSPPALNFSQHQSFPISQLFASGGQSIGASASVFPMNENSGLISFRIDWFAFLAIQGTLKRVFPVPQFESINYSAFSFLYSLTLTSIHDYWKNHSFDYIQTFVGKVISLLFNTLSRFVIAFLPRSKCL